MTFRAVVQMIEQIYNEKMKLLFIKTLRESFFDSIYGLSFLHIFISQNHLR